MFGVGETVGAGIFIVLSQSVPQAGPAVVISFIIAGIVQELAADPAHAGDGLWLYRFPDRPTHTATRPWASLRQLAASQDARSWSNGVSGAAVAVGWSQYSNKLLDKISGSHSPEVISAGRGTPSTASSTCRPLSWWRCVPS